MKNFNDVESIKKLDPQNTLGSTDLLLTQCEEAWKQVSLISVPDDYKNIKTIVCCGMGASIYGALVSKALAGSMLSYPYEVISDYHLPAYVGSDSLVILTSYSGTTEEVLSCANEALQKNAKMLVLTKGGPLAEFAKQHAIPAYIFDGKLNPAGVPRLGNGYSVLGLVGLLAKSGILNVKNEDIISALSYVKTQLETLKSRAQSDSLTFEGKVAVIFAAEHLSGNAQIIRNQFNETSKAFSSYYLVPDLNHHLMEGLQFPKPTNLRFLVINSANYTEKIQKRMMLTIDVVKQNQHEVLEFKTSGSSHYSDFLEVMIYGSYLTLYLGLLYDQNPAVNPWVDWFKDQLAK